jgi:hypothetical protein
MVQDINSDPDYNYFRSFSWSNDFIGRMTSTTYFERVAINGSTSTWDVKQSNTTTAGYSLFSDSWWDVDYLYTRLSTQGRSGENSIDYGPDNVARDTTAQVGLDGGGYQQDGAGQLGKYLFLTFHTFLVMEDGNLTMRVVVSWHGVIISPHQELEQQILQETFTWILVKISNSGMR